MLTGEDCFTNHFHLKSKGRGLLQHISYVEILNDVNMAVNVLASYLHTF